MLRARKIEVAYVVGLFHLQDRLMFSLLGRISCNLK